MNIAIIGTGFVADYYMTTLRNYPELSLRGVYDRSPERLKAFVAHYNVPAYESYEALLADPDVQIVVNLTTPESHFAVSHAALCAGKHVYSEKPLAMDFDDAKALLELARQSGLTLAAAPANGLSDAHKLVSSLIKTIGTPRLVYAEMEDGPVFRDKWSTWRSQSGAPWPGLHEFEIGCTLEHAGYALSWLVSLFGPVESVSAFSAITFPDKGPGTEHLHMAPDFSVGCLVFKSGLVARLTSGLAMPKDRSLTVVADKGSIVVDDLWDNRSAVRLERVEEKRRFLPACSPIWKGVLANSCRGSRALAEKSPIRRLANMHSRPFLRRLISCVGWRIRPAVSAAAKRRFSPAMWRCISRKLRSPSIMRVRGLPFTG